ncbi:bacillithiol biosynthesis deacetylase BshB1 [Chondrinema litorale]|uniref:bacillithiol biosynthesis deacetylase BshB1 n=1 Tax=Chondrinema litorale TaxID=2994555 RepID=UPI002544A43A|nr:bacillithiol biosynthesis deacetylase BshB1 [Chondrinema litorale]UZR94301.1 bacillithiol biosynthesis deacetylase BshB1 [Chondrinema litorale]
MKLDLMVIAAHPDDAELACSGTIMSHIAKGKKVGIVDLTRGELGTRGTAESRKNEAIEASKIMGISVRENLAFADGFFQNDKKHQLELVKVIRKYQPDIVLANTLEDRHPDHARAAQLAYDACFYSGLKKIETKVKDEVQEHWRPNRIFHYIQSNYIKPDFVVDITEFWDKKVEAVKAFKTQFHTGEGESGENQTFISTPTFMRFLESRAREYGQHVGVEFAEGFKTAKPLAVNDLYHFI